MTKGKTMYDEDLDLDVDLQDAVLLLDGCRGVYIPRDFCEAFGERVGLCKEDREILLAGPTHEYYWDTWDDVCNEVTIRDNVGREHYLYQDGDLWAVPVP